MILFISSTPPRVSQISSSCCTFTYYLKHEQQCFIRSIAMAPQFDEISKDTISKINYTAQLQLTIYINVGSKDFKEWMRMGTFPSPVLEQI